jgi:hypothetical protein
LRHSRWQPKDWRVAKLIYSPYRCLACNERFLKVSRRVETRLILMVVVVLIALVIAVTVYMIGKDSHLAGSLLPEVPLRE